MCFICKRLDNVLNTVDVNHITVAPLEILKNWRRLRYRSENDKCQISCYVLHVEFHKLGVL